MKGLFVWQVSNSNLDFTSKWSRIKLMSDRLSTHYSWQNKLKQNDDVLLLTVPGRRSAEGQSEKKNEFKSRI